MVAAVKKLYPQLQVRIEHGIDNGIYCEFDPKGLSLQQIDALRDEMRRMIAQALPIGRRYVKKEEAVRYFKELHMEDKAENIAHRREALCPIDTLDTVDDYFYGHLCLNTADLENVYVYPMKQGCWIGFHPDPRQQEKLYQVYDSYERWGKMLSVANVPQLNQYALHNGIDELILMSEAKIERELVELADRIASQQPFRRFVLISGPSSAGKTTFHIVCVHICACWAMCRIRLPWMIFSATEASIGCWRTVHRISKALTLWIWNCWNVRSTACLKEKKCVCRILIFKTVSAAGAEKP